MRSSLSGKTHCRVEQRLILTTPDGSDFEAQNVNLRWRHKGGTLQTVILELHTAPTTFRERVERQNLFSLTDDVRGPTFAGGFLDGEPIRIEASLDPKLFDELLREMDRQRALLDLDCDSIYYAAAALIGSGPDSPLHETESYRAMYVTQARGPVRTGFKTNWATFTGES